MSVNVVSHPFKFDFVENNPVYVIRNDASNFAGRKLEVRFLVSYPDGRTAQTPMMTYDFDAGGRVEVGTLILRSYFRDAEIPNYGDVFVPRVIGNNTIDYRIEYAEVVDGVRQKNGTDFTLSLHNPAQLVASVTKVAMSTGAYVPTTGDVVTCDYIMGTPHQYQS